MPAIAPLLLFLGGVYLLATIIYGIAKSFRDAARAKKLGCQPVAKLPLKWPLGLDFLVELLQWDNARRLPPFTQELHRRAAANTWEQANFGVPGLVTVDPKNIQHVLAVQFDDFVIGTTRRNNFYPLLGNGIFTSDGKDWAHARALLRPQFMREQIAQLDSFESHTKTFFKFLPTTTNAQGENWTDTLNMQPLLARLILDAATEFLCGRSVLSQLGALPEHLKQKDDASGDDELDWSQFGANFDKATEALGIRVRLFDRYWMYYPLWFHRSCKKVHAFVDHYVHRALAENPGDAAEKEKTAEKNKYVFLYSLMKDTRDPIELRSQLLNILIAGRDTTAGTLSWAFYELSRNPRCFQKLRAEVVERFGTYNKPKEITFEGLKDSKYLQNTLREVLRLYPNVPMNSRRAVRDTTLPRGGGPDGSAPIFIKKGQEVNYYVFVMHRRKDLWGKDAEIFHPERFEGRKIGWEYLPFNGGPRVCLGQQFAMTEAGYILVRIMQRFEDCVCMDDEPLVRHTYNVTTTPCRVLLKFREDPSISPKSSELSQQI